MFVDDDGADAGQARSRSLVDFLGGEEQVQEAIADSFRGAGAGFPDTDFQPGIAASRWMAWETRYKCCAFEMVTLRIRPLPLC